MADCDIPVVSLPDLTCVADLRAWGVQLESAMQAIVDHIVGCIQDFEIPQLDICVSKDDLVECPLGCDMVDFSGVTYAEEGGRCQLPNPPNLGDYEFRHGTAFRTPAFGDAWRSVAIEFSTPFTTTCLWLGPTMEYDQNCERQEGAPPTACISGVDIDGTGYSFVVQDYTATGCTVWIKREGIECDCEPVFRYFAVGH